MKRILLLIPIFFMICGCANHKTNKTAITQNISFEAIFEISGKEYNCFIKSENDSIYATFLKPAQLKDLTAKIRNDKIEMNFNGLSHNFELSALPQGQILGYLYKILQDSNGKPLEFGDDSFIVDGEINNQKYKLIFGGSGFPISLEINNTTIFFNDVKLISAKG